MGNTDPDLLDPFLEAGQRLVNRGVRAITTSCGFLSIFQRELAAAFPVPVLSSSLLQVPLAASQIGSHEEIGILTEKPDFLSERHFNGAGWSSKNLSVVVHPLPSDALFPQIYGPRNEDEPAPEFDFGCLRQEIVDAGRELLRLYPSVGAIVLECTNFVPYSQALRDATGLPVFDLFTLVTHSHGALKGQTFA
jgi:hypothetical protein